MKKNNTLFEQLNIDDVSILLFAFPYLSRKYRQVLRKAYGVDLMSEFDSSMLTESERKNGVFLAIRSLKNIIRNTEVFQVTIYPERVGKNSPYFYEKYGEYDPRDVLSVFDNLDHEYKDILSRVFGNFLLDSFDMTYLNDEELEMFYEGIQLLEEGLNSFHKVSLSHPTTYLLGYQYLPKRKGTKPKNVFELNPNYSKQEVLAAIMKLDEDDRNFLMIGYGREFDDLSGRNQMTTKEKSHLSWIIRGPLKYCLEHPDELEEKNILVEQLQNPFDYYKNYSREDIQEAILRLSEEHRDLLNRSFHNNAFVSSEQLSHDEFSQLKNIILKELYDKISYIQEIQSIFHYFKMYSEEEVILSILELSNHDIEFLKTIYGDDFNHLKKKELSSSEIEQLDFLLRKIKMYIHSEEVFHMNVKEKKSNTIYRKNITSNFVYDRLTNLPYSKLNRQEEIDFIKKAKLSYYDSADEEEKKLYLEYYMEMFPSFRKSWEEADDTKKERLLRKAIQNSLRYRNKFFENNYRLILSIAKHYTGLDDTEVLFQVGFFGIVRALEKFDIKKGTRFSTYATLWIRQFITKYLADYSSTIRIPVQRREQIFRLEKAQNELISQLGRAPSKEELLLASNIDESQLDFLEEYQSFLYTTSLNRTVGEGNDEDTLEDFIPDDSPNPYLNIEGSMMKDTFIKIINQSKLSIRDKKILFMRYGFYDARPYTLEEIGKIFNITRERVRQIERKSLRTLRITFLKNSISADDFSFGTVTEDDYVPFDSDNINNPSENSNDQLIDPSLRDNTIAEVLMSSDLSQFDQYSREILNLRYGLTGVKASVEEIAKYLSISEESVCLKEQNALKIIFSNLKVISPKVDQVKKMILK